MLNGTNADEEPESRGVVVRTEGDVGRRAEGLGAKREDEADREGAERGAGADRVREEGESGERPKDDGDLAAEL